MNQIEQAKHLVYLRAQAAAETALIAYHKSECSFYQDWLEQEIEKLEAAIAEYRSLKQNPGQVSSPPTPT